MPRLLVSVRDAAEARAAVSGGADIVDVKEPARGALGAADPAVWAAVLRVCDGRADVSVALGEAAPLIWERPPDAPPTPLPAGLRWAKLGPGGLAGGARDARRWEIGEARAQFLPPPESAGPFDWVTVAYADHAGANAPPPDELLETETTDGTGAGRIFLLDTFTKDGRGLLDRLTEEEVTRLCGAAHAVGFAVALAGSLRLGDIPRAVRCGADVIAVRGAACDGPRTGRVREGKVAALKDALD